MEQESCNAMEGLFTTLKSLKFPKLGRQMNENAEERMGILRLAAVECNYEEIFI